MDPIRRKLSSLLTEAANEEIKALDLQSPCAKQLSQIENVDTIIAEEIEKICNAATLTEITKVRYLALRIKKTSGREKEAIKRKLSKIVEQVVTRAESQSGPLKLPQSCRHILLGI